MKDKNYSSKLFCVVASLLIIATVSLDVFGDEASDTKNLFSMSLEQLMDVGVYAPGTLTERNRLKTPASVTVITARDIAITPARNILDLMEIYVPGMLYMNHSAGPEPGIRGIIADKPYKFLVNVDGINVNIKSTYGARLELLNWELSDIDRIEVVRGPGSVTYGPGAIGGVINIFTKKAKQAQGWEFGGQYLNKYESVGNYVSYGKVKDDFELYTYFSVTDTEGTGPDLFGSDRGTVNGVKNTPRTGYLGKGGNSPYSPYPPSTYMGDFFEQPGIKAHLNIKFNDNWRFWGRYASESSGLMQSSARQQLVNGQNRDIFLSQFRYFQLALENKSPINKDWELKSTFGLSSTDIRDIQQKYVLTGDPENSLLNYGWMYSEWKYYAQFMLNYKPDDSRIKGALGFELSYDLIRPSWGKNKDNGLRLGSDYGIISGPSSDAFGTGSGQIDSDSDDYYPVGAGFETLSHAIIGELNIELTPKSSVILSGRFDKNTYTDYLFSPRFAFIHELKKNEYLKFIVQRSVRMNTLDELYINNKNGITNFPEKLDMLELIWSKKVNENWSFQNSAFWSKNKAIGWDSTSRSAAPLGTLELFGVEAEIKYQKDNFEFGINHSVVKQLSWKLAEGITTSGISNSDYFGSSSTLPGGVGSKGNDLSNWANQSTKLYTNIDLLEKKITLHGDAVAFWGFEGYKDGLDAFEEAGGDAASIQTIRDHDAFKPEIRANISLTWHINKSADFTVFVQNIPLLGDNKRYSYSSGQKNIYADKTAWVEEPLVVGFKYKIRF
ncbi:MAG: TonB-dependent receptor [Phycisphaerae bacterium]|jgi:outer membrane receptor protein involved in Fe transport